MTEVVCKTCGRTLPLTVEYFHKHPHNKTGFFGSCRSCRNKKRNAKKSKYTYYYEIEKGDEFREGEIKAKDKDSALRIMKIKFYGWEIKKLCTFKYKDQPIVRQRRGNEQSTRNNKKLY